MLFGYKYYLASKFTNEFRGEVFHLDTMLLQKLELFENLLGAPVIFSPADGALFRDDEDSYHSKGLAVDVMLPQGPTLKTAALVAKEVGFSGIGVYPDWAPHQGLHLDIRPKKGIAQWGAIKDNMGKQVYVGIERVIGERL